MSECLNVCGPDQRQIRDHCVQPAIRGQQARPAQAVWLPVVTLEGCMLRRCSCSNHTQGDGSDDALAAGHLPVNDRHAAESDTGSIHTRRWGLLVSCFTCSVQRCRSAQPLCSAVAHSCSLPDRELRATVTLCSSCRLATSAHWGGTSQLSHQSGEQDCVRKTTPQDVHLRERNVAVVTLRRSGGQSAAGTLPSGSPASVLQATPPSAAAVRQTAAPAFKLAAAAQCSTVMTSVTSAFCAAAAILLAVLWNDAC